MLGAQWSYEKRSHDGLSLDFILKKNGGRHAPKMQVCADKINESIDEVA
jgi:hypothetical protein